MLSKMAQAILAKVPVGYGMTLEEATEYAKAAIEAIEQTHRLVPIGPDPDCKTCGGTGWQTYWACEPRGTWQGAWHCPDCTPQIDAALEGEP